MAPGTELEVAVYLQNFHNLDLFQQGWYAVRLTCFWENESPVPQRGVPSRVLQYRVPEGDVPSMWQIGDADNSYRTRVFRVRYARQDVPLLEMASFQLKVQEHVLEPVVVKFELLYAGHEHQKVQSQPPEELQVASSHSFRIIAGAWHGHHAYCAVTFDSLHMAKLDATLHTALLGFSRKLPLPSSSQGHLSGGAGGGHIQEEAGTLHGGEAWAQHERDGLRERQGANGIEEGRRGGAPPLPADEGGGGPVQLAASRGGYDQGKAAASDVTGSSSVQQEQAAEGRRDHPGTDPDAVRLLRLLLASYEALSRELSGLIAAVAPEEGFQLPPRSEPSALANRLARSPPPGAGHPSPNRGDAPAGSDSETDASIWSGALSPARSSPLTSFHLSEEDGVPADGRAAVGGDERRLPEDVTEEEVDAELQGVASRISVLWNSFRTFHRLHHETVCGLLRERWLEARAAEAALWVIGRELWMQEDDMFGHEGGDWVAKWRAPQATLSRKPQEEGPSYSAARASLYRDGLSRLKCRDIPLQDLQLFGSPARQPVIFADRHNAALKGRPPVASSPRSPLREEAAAAALQEGAGGKGGLSNGHSHHGRRGGGGGRAAGKHVIFFVHGFQGHHMDLRLVRDHWLLLDPGAECVMSDANEDRTLDSLAEMGARLADEVAGALGSLFGHGRQHATKWSAAGPLEKISFVGHSLGNLIIRAALTDDALSPYLRHMHAFVSISAPHLGYLYSSNNVFNGGLWLLKHLNKGSAVMHELTLTDRPDMRDCYLYRLSQAQCWEYFKHVLLLSSPQDKYVPYHSARIELCPAAMRDAKRGALYASMVQGCLAPLLRAASDGEHSFVRADVNFDTSAQARSFSTYIGRTAHIDFLETDAYIRSILAYYWDCLK